MVEMIAILESIPIVAEIAKRDTQELPWILDRPILPFFQNNQSILFIGHDLEACAATSSDAENHFNLISFSR
jgi:hypothetical protein